MYIYFFVYISEVLFKIVHNCMVQDDAMLYTVQHFFGVSAKLC
jgi:hypothetical protein